MQALAPAQATIRRRLATAAAGTLAVTGAALVAFVAPGGAGAAPASVTTYAQLSQEVADSHNVVLGGDISGTGPLVIGTKRPVAIDLGGFHLTVDNSASTVAGIEVPATAELILKDPPNPGTGKLDVKGGTGHAGIEVAAGATLTVRGGTMTAITTTGGTGGAGIGGGTGQAGGDIAIHQGIVKATGGTGAAGIGGGTGGNAGTVLVTDGQVTGTGGTGGAGIGGGNGGNGGPLTINTGFVIGLPGTGASGVGAGAGGSAGDTAVQIDPMGALTAEGSPAITLGSLNNAGTLRVLEDDSDLPIPAGITAQNSGLIRLYGTLSGTGTLHNSGTILPTPIYSDSLVADDGQGPAGSKLLITEHNYTIPFSLDGLGGTQPDTQHVYAKDIATARQTLPPVPAAPGYTCADGWYTAASGGTQVTDTTLLSTVTAYGPSTLVLHRHCARVAYTVTFDTQGGAPTPDPQTVPSGEHATRPDAPAKSGNTFTGWFTAATGGRQWDFATDVVTSDITLYAQYTATTSPAPGGSGVGGVSTSNPTGGSGIDAVSASSSGTGLADTGPRTFGTLTLAVLLLVLGAALTVVGSRRRPGRGNAQ